MKILAHGLTKDYGNNRAVNGIDLSVDNEVYGLLGPNGSGKTTTVSMLTTLMRPTAGSAVICGHDIATEQSAVRECMSYVPQDMAVDIRMTGRENVDFFARLYGIRDRHERRRRVEDALEIMNLSDRADDLTKGYSGGMRRRLELAQALELVLDLELDLVLQELATCAGSLGGKEACLRVRPVSDLEDVNLMLEQTTAAADLCTRKGNPVFGDVTDVSASLERAERGRSLQPRYGSGRRWSASG